MIPKKGLALDQLETLIDNSGATAPELHRLLPWLDFGFPRTEPGEASTNIGG